MRPGDGGAAVSSTRSATRLGVVLAALALAGTWESGGAQTGRIEGNVVISRPLSVRKPRIRLYSDWGPGAVPRPSASDTNTLGQVVIYVDSVPARTPGPDSAPPARAVRQLNEGFVPHALAVVKGSTVEFPNDDAVFHNVFSLSSTRTFDLGRYPKGVSKSVRFDRPGIVQVFCHIHADMSAIVLVLDNPFFAVPDTAGRYVIDHVPPGEYRVVAWHERIKPIARQVRVAPGQSVTLDWVVPLLLERADP